MKKLHKVIVASVFLGVAGLCLPDMTESFHDGGVGPCHGCHSMHNALDISAVAGEKALLLASDPSSVCLNCHAGPGGGESSSVFSPDGSALTPGGDFYWLTKTFIWGGGSSPGDSHGHNIVAQDFNLSYDLTLTVSPGGNYQAVNLGCTSCHDPHGQAQGGTRQGAPPVSVSGSYGELPASSTSRGNYRLLGDVFYGGGLAAAGYQFNYNAPVARQNINNRFAETDSSHIDYGSGMSEWCGNCHNAILQSDHKAGGGGFEHPAGSTASLSNEIINMYNTYINTGDLLMSGVGTGLAATAYLQFAPFERGISDPQLLDPTSTQGPSTNSRVMCLTCHRAHASAFSSIGRWDLGADLLAQSHPAPGDGGVTGNDVSNSYYGREIAVEFGPGQGPFCEKCHGISGVEPMLESGEQQLPEKNLFQDPFKLFREKRRF